MNCQNYEIGPGSAPDTGHEPVANHVSFADYAHQQMVLGDALNDEIHADTGQEPVADYAFLASPAHQQVVLGETLNDKLIETNPRYGHESDPGNGVWF